MLLDMRASYSIRGGRVTDPQIRHKSNPQISSAPVHRIILFLRSSGVSDRKIAEALGVGTGKISRILAQPTLSVYSADEIACAWGEHPCAWWSEWGSDLSEEDDAA